MKKFFYFSEKELGFVEIKNFKLKTITFIVLSSFILASILFTIFYFMQTYLLGFDKDKLISENKVLKAEIKNLNEKYSKLISELNDLGILSNKLRIAVNLKPIDEKERFLGKGGSILTSEFINKLKYVNDINESFLAIENIIKRFEFEKLEYEYIARKISDNEKFLESVPVLIPTEGEFSIDGFGMRLHPILKVMRMHNGVDILNDVGTPVYAPGSGKVVYVGKKVGLGITLEIDHGFGYKTVYGHLHKVLVKEGQLVKRGDKIALSGNTGLSSGPHLHYEIHFNGIPQDPIYYFIEHSKTYLADRKNKVGGN
jgi:murein DD-endopeptidase MepM/ murein hydrolase activator NlpD